MAETPVVPFLEIVQNGMSSYALRQSDWIDARVLAANTAETFQAPTGARFVLFSGDANFYARMGTVSSSATIPSTDVTDGSASELNPAMRAIREQEYISLISGSTAIVTMQYFRG